MFRVKCDVLDIEDVQVPWRIKEMVGRGRRRKAFRQDPVSRWLRQHDGVWTELFMGSGLLLKEARAARHGATEQLFSFSSWGRHPVSPVASSKSSFCFSSSKKKFFLRQKEKNSEIADHFFSLREARDAAPRDEDVPHFVRSWFLVLAAVSQSQYC